jgi:hypothetical protein
MNVNELGKFKIKFKLATRFCPAKNIINMVIKRHVKLPRGSKDGKSVH